MFASAELLRTSHSADGPATELLHVAIHSPRGPYGVPRWVGALLVVLGSRQMREVNYLFFENKSVPPLALLILGGPLSESSLPRIERFIEENRKGRANFHKILILEAKGGQGENRATAESALRFAEDQVFQPERDEFDYLINRKLLADKGIRFWRFRSQTPVTRDPERMTAMVEKLVRVGVLTLEEEGFLARDIFNREFRKIGDDGTKQSIMLTLAGILTGVERVPVPRPNADPRRRCPMIHPLRVVAKRPCRLDRGELRRNSQDRR